MAGLFFSKVIQKLLFLTRIWKGFTTRNMDNQAVKLCNILNLKLRILSTCLRKQLSELLSAVCGCDPRNGLRCVCRWEKRTRYRPGRNTVLSCDWSGWWYVDKQSWLSCSWAGSLCSTFYRSFDIMYHEGHEQWCHKQPRWIVLVTGPELEITLGVKQATECYKHVNMGENCSLSMNFNGPHEMHFFLSFLNDIWKETEVTKSRPGERANREGLKLTEEKACQRYSG